MISEKQYDNFPTGKRYSIIYADPPWSYRDKAMAGNRGAGCKYQIQSKEWIDNLPVNEIAARDAVLFLWITMPKLNEVWDLFPSWGFTFKTCAFVWIKRNRNASGWFTRGGEWFLGMERWKRANAELCLLGTRGKPKRISASVSSIIEAPLERHSKKPDEVRDRIVKLCGDLPRIELFARQTAPGWDAWGNEI